MGFADARIANANGLTEAEMRNCANRRASRRCSIRSTPAAPSSKRSRRISIRLTKARTNPSDERKKIMILGGGPNRIGQGIEFDYCCVHAAFALKEEGYETIMVNCNPETVSTDYDTSDKLYFEPLTMEEVMNIVDRENPDGVIVQFGGQTPLKLALAWNSRSADIGTSPDNIDLAEDRERFSELINRLGIKQPENGIARSYEEAFKIAERSAIRCWSAFLCARRPCHADRLRRGGFAKLHDSCGVSIAGASGVDR